MNKKQLLMILGLTTLATAANINASYSNLKSNFSNEYLLNEIIENSKNNDSTKLNAESEYEKFKSLPENKKKEVISSIDKYIEKNMHIVKLAKEINRQIDIPIIETDAIPEEGYMGYENLSKIIGKGKAVPEKVIMSYLSGIPIIHISEAHEKIHAVQNMNNKWYNFEKFIYKHAINKDSDSMSVPGFLDEKTAKEFSDKFSNGKKLTQSEIQSTYIGMINHINSSREKRNFYKEIQAHIFFSWYYDETTLKSIFDEIPIYRNMMKGITSKEFKTAIDANILLLGLSSGMKYSWMGIIDGAKMLGKYDTDIEGFYQNVLKIAKPYDIENVRNAGMKVKQDMFNDAFKLSHETMKRIDSVYKSLKK